MVRASEDRKAYTRDCEKRAVASGAFFFFVCLHCHGAGEEALILVTAADRSPRPATAIARCVLRLANCRKEGLEFATTECRLDILLACHRSPASTEVKNMDSSTVSVVAGVAANASVAATKFIAAAATGSGAMLAEAIHSLVDTVNSSLMLLGIRLSRRPPDDQHPFGHGMEVYFWTLIVALMIFAVGGGATIIEGISHLLRSGEPEDPTWNYVVLGCAAVFEGISWTVAARKFWKRKGNAGIWKAIRTSKDPTVVTVLIEDTTALIGLVIAAIGVFTAQQTGSSVPDGIASIVIGLLMAAAAAVLARESRSLLLGERATPELIESVKSLAAEDPAIQHAGHPLTMQLGPEEVLLNLEVQFQENLSVIDFESAVDRLEKRIKASIPIESTFTLRRKRCTISANGSTENQRDAVGSFLAAAHCRRQQGHADRR